MTKTYSNRLLAICYINFNMTSTTFIMPFSTTTSESLLYSTNSFKDFQVDPWSWNQKISKPIVSKASGWRWFWNRTLFGSFKGFEDLFHRTIVPRMLLEQVFLKVSDLSKVFKTRFGPKTKSVILPRQSKKVVLANEKSC